MILKGLKLENFRSYQNFTIDFDENLNVIIGRNDIGKSTILEALDIFFGQERIKIEIADKNVFVGNFMSISCLFKIDTNQDYLIDTDVRTNLKDEFLLNADGYLEIKKVWDCSKDKLTATSLKTYLICNYPKEFSKNPLPTLKIEDLKKVLEKKENSSIAFSLHDKINNNELEGIEIGPYGSDMDSKIPIEIDKRKRADIRRAIYQVLEDKELRNIEIPLDKEDGKNIWESISKDLPLFFLFQSDRANKDSDKEVQDPLKVITKTAIENVIDKLDEVKELIRQNAETIGNETIKKLEEMNPDLAKVLKPDVSNKAWDTLFSFSFIGDDNIPMNKRGSGVRRLILLNYFRAEADRQNTNNKNIIYGIEEPETSQHPNHQQLLIDALIEIANKENHQVLITTHSPEIAKQCKNENLILIDSKDGKNILVKDDFKLKSIVKTLGITAYLSKLVICVEGENDRAFLLNINQNVPELKSIIDITKEGINIIPMTGSTLIRWIERDYLDGSNIIEFHVYDRDSDLKYKDSIEQLKSRGNGSCGILTQKLEFENYIAPELYENKFKVDCSTIKDWDNQDIPQFVMNKSSMFKEKNGEAEKIVKSIANGSLSKQMTMELFEKIHAFDEIKDWFLTIRKMFEK